MILRDCLLMDTQLVRAVRLRHVRPAIADCQDIRCHAVLHNRYLLLLPEHIGPVHTAVHGDAHTGTRIRARSRPLIDHKKYRNHGKQYCKKNHIVSADSLFHTV